MSDIDSSDVGLDVVGKLVEDSRDSQMGSMVVIRGNPGQESRLFAIDFERIL